MTLAEDHTPDNWFVAQLKPNGLETARRHLARQGLTTLAPQRRATRRRGARLVEVPEPVFPGYLLVQFDPDAARWRAINSTRGVTRLLVDDPRAPRPLPRAFCAELLARCAGDTVLAPQPLKPGDPVRVVSGPFADALSQVESLTPDGRVRLLLRVLGGATPVEIAAEALELTARSA